MKSIRLILAPLTVERLFLLDGLGAVVTAVLLGTLLTTFEPWFGMPKHILLPLSVVAACFAVYSLTCRVRAAGAPWLLGIAAANALYCVCTLSLVFWLRSSLTWLGVAYFVGEIAVISTLVIVELSVARRGPR
ncbi:MAG: hypothetical protein Q8Q09_11050 [Deltaproteobacteria bacterium]|nr:hypothetical protein [Deltaproteobacteria bacterium]